MQHRLDATASTAEPASVASKTPRSAGSIKWAPWSWRYRVFESP